MYTTEDRTPSLEESGRKRLYDADAPPCTELRRLNKDLLSLFTRLVKDLCEPLPPDVPEQPHIAHVQAIEDTMVNMQHLVNLMRPAQAALDLKTILNRQTAARREMTEKLKESVKKSWDLIGEAAAKLTEPSAELSEQTKALLAGASDTPNLKINGTAEEREHAENDEDEDKTVVMTQMLEKISQVTQDSSL